MSDVSNRGDNTREGEPPLAFKNGQSSDGASLPEVCPLNNLPEPVTPSCCRSRRCCWPKLSACAWKGAGVLLVAALLGTALWGYLKKGPLAPSGGLYFPARCELQVASFRQGDQRWGNDPLGWTEATLGAEGCAVACVAMVLDFYGVKTDPQQLNWYLGANAGYTDQGWLYWERAADLAPDRVRHVYEDLPSYFLIDWNLLRGNPVVVRIKFPSGTNHFVVIAGKQGFNYLIRDPGAGASKGFYPLRELGSNIEALRYYQKLTPSG